MINEPFTLSDPDPNTGISSMIIRGETFEISPKALPDDEWATKMQAKANAFAAMIESCNSLQRTP